MADSEVINDNRFHERSAFGEAFNTYLATLQKKPKSRKLDFIIDIQASVEQDGVEGLEASIRKLQSKCERQGLGTKTETILLPVIKAIKTYSSIVDVFVSAHPMPVALIWGSFRVFVECASISLDLCQKLQEQMEELEIMIRRLTSYERFYYDYPGVQSAIGRSYVNILEFWYQASKWCRGRALGFRRALKAPASIVKIDKALKHLNDQADRLEKLSKDAERELTHEARRRHGNEALEAKEHRRLDDKFKHLMLLESLRKWLGGTHESSAQQYDHFIAKKHPGSCQWLIRHDLFTSWWAGRISPSVLWVQGRPGAGKSILCSAAIEEVKKSPNEMAAAFTFLRLAQKAGPIQLLRDLSVQLLYQMFQRQRQDQDIPESLYTVLRSDRDVLANVKVMFEQLVKQLLPVYVFLDGLNEVEGDLEDILKFFIGMASSGRLRLWCSSQYTPDVERALEGQNKLLVTAADTQDDIESYLSKTIPQHVTEGDMDFISKFQKIVLVDTKGCFLWASNMIEALANAVSEDERKMLILDRLPHSMDQYYAGLFERLNNRDKSGWNLVKIVLSIVTFAKRPLRVSELREAIAILRGKLGDNLSIGALPLRNKIIEYCSPLIECIDSSVDAENGQIQLSHSVVRDFLKKHADQSRGAIPTFTQGLNLPKTEPYVSSQTIAESCLRYLMQRRYSHLRVKKTRSTFDVSSVYDTKNDHLLQYAAEFWSHHFESVEPTENNQSLLLTFVRSFNLFAWIQIQSLYLNGMTKRVSSNNRGLDTKRVLPSWFAETPTGSAVESGYWELIGEWGHLLRQGVLWTANGEIDRCFWGALGPINYLSKAKGLERYPSFIFMEETDSKGRHNAYDAHATSPDGKQLMLAVLENGRSGDEGFADSMTLRLERWDLDGSGGAFMEQKHEISQLRSEVPEFLYSASEPHRFDLVPETFSRSRPAAVAISSDLHHMRVGASLLSNTSTEISMHFKSLAIESNETIPYWEEIASRGSVVALARRRAPRQADQYMDGCKIVNLEDRINDAESVEGLDEDWDVSSRGSGLTNAEVQSLYSESSHDENWKQVEDIVLPADKEDLVIGRVLDSSSESDFSEASAGHLILSDDDNLNDGARARHYPGIDTTGLDPKLEEDPFEYEEQFHHRCHLCKNTFVVHYKCRVCTSYDICEPCFDAGKWCPDVHHSLTKKMYWDQEGGDTVSYEDLALVQELVVLDTSEGEPRQLYRFSRTSEVLIFDSPPVFHPTASLLVWLLSRDKILLVDFEANDSFIHQLPPSSIKMQRISAIMKISPCGLYLHIISFEAPVRKRSNPTSPPIAQSNGEGGFQTSVHLMTYNLSADNIDKSFRLILSVRFSLSPLTQSSFIRIPFAVTWQPKEAYITVSDSELKVYKVSLIPQTGNDLRETPLLRRRTISLDDSDEDVDDNDHSARSYVSVLLQPLLLPFSAKDRIVQFFPPLGPDPSNATLIIGPRSASSSARLSSTPPIAVYLPATSFSVWVPLAVARKAEISSLNKVFMPLGGKFEDLGPGEELDLIRYRTLEGTLQSSAGLEDYGPTIGDRRRFEIRYGEDLELVYGKEKMLMRRVDIDDGYANDEGEAGGEEPEVQRRVFKTSTGAGTAVLKAGAMDDRAKMIWFRDVGPALEVWH